MAFNSPNKVNGSTAGKRFEGDTDINAFLGEGTNFKGVLAFEGTVRIDGKLEGEITSEDTLVVGEHAIVNAEINVGTIVISGKISGDITAKIRVDIKSTGEVYGNIQTPILTIEEGVIFQGTCDMRRGGSSENVTALLGKPSNEGKSNSSSIETLDLG
ncbi:MAG: polymer-forming cytoskeletal protein [Candidatus Schekmanbacteria bacterium]|nr:polymer-forming cytoskeletal protein [Candidatus Schekmanbacteria bacterium]